MSEASNVTTKDLSVRPRRSALYMPASNARAVAKAREVPCDMVILDLEDAVAPEMKVAARHAAVEALRSHAFGSREVLVRCNGLDTEWALDDLRAVASAPPDGVLVPKVSTSNALGAARAALGSAPIPLWAMIETCEGLLNIRAIATCAQLHGLRGMVAGTNDLATEMRCWPGPRREPLLPFLTMIVASARSVGLVVLDGVHNSLDAGEHFLAECQQGLAFGFDGKTLVHPSQIDAANQTFTPSEEVCGRMKQIVDAFHLPENTTRSAIRVGNRMIERMHLKEAERVLAIAETCRASRAKD